MRSIAANSAVSGGPSPVAYSHAGWSKRVPAASREVTRDSTSRHVARRRFLGQLTEDPLTVATRRIGELHDISATRARSRRGKGHDVRLDEDCWEGPELEPMPRPPLRQSPPRCMRCRR